MQAVLVYLPLFSAIQSWNVRGSPKSPKIH